LRYGSLASSEADSFSEESLSYAIMRRKDTERQTLPLTCHEELPVRRAEMRGDGKNRHIAPMES
jgi:hypothetical protein